MDFCFVVHKLATFSSNTGKVHCEGMVQLLGYIRYNKNLVLIYYASIEYAPLFDHLRRYSIKYEKKLMVFF